MAKTKLRELQDQALNHGWRIVWIPHDDGEQTQWTPKNWPALGGAFCFLAGIASLFLSPRFGIPAGQGVIIGLTTSVFGLVIMFLALWRSGRRKRRGWITVTARCVDLERQRIMTHRSPNWAARMICEFQFDGQIYRATPLVHYKTFLSEEGLIQYLASRISTAGQCELHINPKNPLECELAGQGIQEKLLY